MEQTCQDFLLIISDDCGPDGSDASSYVESLKDPRITYIRQPKNLGLAGNWNYCLDAAQTDLVTLLHADDFLAPEYVASMIRMHAERPNATMVFCGAHIVGESGDKVFSFADFVKERIAPKTVGEMIVRGDDGLASLLKGCFIMCPTICYRKAAIPDLRFSSRWRMVVDLDFYARVIFSDGLIVGIPDRLYYYRRHASNQTTVLTESLIRFVEESKIYDEIAEKCAALDWTAAARVGRKKTIIKLNLAYCILRDFLQLKPFPAFRKMKFLVFGL